MRRRDTGYLLICLILFSLVPEYEFRRGGGGIGGARSGGSRTSGGFGSRGSSGARTSSGGGGGLFGGSRSHSGGSASSAGSRQQPRPNNNGYGMGSGGGYNNQGGGYRSNNMNTGSGGGKGGFFGSIFGRKNNNHQPSGGGYGNNRGGMFGRSSSWSNSGIGSKSRGSQFKNMIVGAAAGYLTYRAGKALIRAAAGPMMWNNRPYYWGSNHYRASPGHSNMCRMPIDNNDQQFGNVYFEDNTRPREITWGCGYYEYCCGYECCRGGSAPSDRIGGRGSSIGILLVICLGLLCAFPIVTRYIRRRQFGTG